MSRIYFHRRPFWLPQLLMGSSWVLTIRSPRDLTADQLVMRVEGGEVRVTWEGPWPAGDCRPRSRRGPGVKSFTPDPSGPSGRDPLVTVTITAQLSIRGGAGRIGTRSGLDAGGATPHNPRLPLSDATTVRLRPGQPCRAPAARRARGAERERAHSRMQRRRVRAVSARLDQSKAKFSPTVIACLPTSLVRSIF